MGEVLVTKTPDWQTMTQESAEKWWGEVMKGKQWYATTTPSPSPLIIHSNFAKKPKKSEQTPTSSFSLDNN